MRKSLSRRNSQARPRTGKRGSRALQERCEPLSVEDEVFLQPWFVPKDVYLEIRRLLPNIHLSKMRYYFEDYGCLRCGTHGILYGSNGLCERCSVVIRGRLARCLKRRLRKVGVLGPEEQSSHFEDAMTSAQDLLRGFRYNGPKRKNHCRDYKPVQ
jgi:hypothetical protein